MLNPATPSPVKISTPRPSSGPNFAIIAGRIPVTVAAPTPQPLQTLHIAITGTVSLIQFQKDHKSIEKEILLRLERIGANPTDQPILTSFATTATTADDEEEVVIGISIGLQASVNMKVIHDTLKDSIDVEGGYQAYRFKFYPDKKQPLKSLLSALQVHIMETNAGLTSRLDIPLDSIPSKGSSSCKECGTIWPTVPIKAPKVPITTVETLEIPRKVTRGLGTEPTACSSDQVMQIVSNLAELGDDPSTRECIAMDSSVDCNRMASAVRSEKYPDCLLAEEGPFAEYSVSTWMQRATIETIPKRAAKMLAAAENEPLTIDNAASLSVSICALFAALAVYA